MNSTAASALLDTPSQGADLNLLGDAELLQRLELADRQVSLARADRARLIAEAERRESAMRVRLCSTATFLASSGRHTPARARRIVAESLAVQRLPSIADATVRGRASFEQGVGIAAGLRELPDALGEAELADVQTTLLGFCDCFDPLELKTLAHRLGETIDPEGAERAEADRLEAEERLAQRNRRLTLVADGLGSYVLAGKLPLAEGAELSAIPEAHLVSGLGCPTIECGQPLTATQLRRLACDADLLPVVLGGAGVPLAHHWRPRWAGGVTAMDNLVLLCPHHHGVIEPPRGRPWDQPDPDRWVVRFIEGVPVFIPPVTVDPTQRPPASRLARRDPAS